MRQFMFKALLVLDAPVDGRSARQYATGTRKLMVHARCLGQPSYDKDFPAAITCDDDHELRPGRSEVVTVTVADDEAVAFFAPGQHFTIWGGAAGHGVVSRRAFTSSGPC